MTRDTRDPQELGNAISHIKNKSGLTACEAADLLDGRAQTLSVTPFLSVSPTKIDPVATIPSADNGGPGIKS